MAHLKETPWDAENIRASRSFHRRTDIESVLWADPILKEQEAGTPVADLCRTYGMHSETFYAWKRRYTGMQSSDVQKLKQVTEENAQLRKVVANLSLEVDALKDALKKLVTTQAKRDMASYLIERWSLSDREACRLVHLSRTVFDYQAVPSDDAEVREALRDLAREHPNYGCPMLTGDSAWVS